MPGEHRRFDPVNRPPRRSAPGPRPRPGRQVDLPPRADPVRPHGRREHGRRPLGGRGRPAHRRRHAGPGRSAGARRRRGVAHPRGRGGWFCCPGGGARFRQFRHRLPAGARRGGRLPGDRDLRRRCLLAQAADAPRARSPGAHGRPGDRGGRRRPAADHPARRRRPDADRLRIAGAVGAAQIGGAAGWIGCAGRNNRDRGGGEPRPHRAPAQAFRRQGRHQAARPARPPHHAHRPAGTRARACGGAGRSVVGRVSRWWRR